MSDKAMAQAAADRLDCEKVWQLTWPWVARYNKDAMASMAGAMLGLGLYPPGVKRTEADWYKTFLTLSLYGYSDGYPFMTDFVPDLLRRNYARSGGAKVATCLQTTNSTAACIQNAIRNGIVFELRDFVKVLSGHASDEIACISTDEKN